MDDSYIHKNDSMHVKKLKDLEATVFISTGELERKDLIEQTSGLVSMLNDTNYKNLSLEYMTIESSDHGKAFPMTAVRAMY